MTNTHRNHNLKRGGLNVKKKSYTVKCSTYNRNKKKACQLAYHQNIAKNKALGILKGQKVTSFVHNIVHEGSECITIDQHAFNAALGRIWIDSKKGPGINPRWYARFSDAYHNIAREYGIRGYQAQAIAWVVWRSKPRRHWTKTQS